MLVLNSQLPMKSQFERLLSNKAISERLSKMDIKTPNDIKARFFADNDIIKLYLKTFTAGGENENVFFDYFPFIEIFLLQIEGEEASRLSKRRMELEKAGRQLAGRDRSGRDRHP